jgi:hypothetical protein
VRDDLSKGSKLPFAAKRVVSRKSAYKGCTKVDIAVGGSGDMMASGYNLRN